MCTLTIHYKYLVVNDIELILIGPSAVLYEPNTYYRVILYDLVLSPPPRSNCSRLTVRPKSMTVTPSTWQCDNQRPTNFAG